LKKKLHRCVCKKSIKQQNMSTPSGTWSYTSTPVPTQQAKFTTTNISAKRVEGAGLYQRHPLGASALLVPPGSISAYAGISVPGGWLHCDGSALDRTIYADLFAAIGTTFGAGDGETTFNIPNLRGRNIIGLNSSDSDFDQLGETGGEKRHTLTIGEMPAHTHTITDPGHAHGITDPSHAHGVTDPGHSHFYINQVGDQGVNTLTTQNDAADQADYTQVTSSSTTGVTVNAAVTGVTVNTGLTGINITNSTGGSESHNVLDPFMALRYIIKV
jgi:microcystin-dependent protein